MNFIRTNFKGILLCITIAIPSWLLGKHFPLIGGPVFGIIIGMIVTMWFKSKESFQTGINFTSKKILQYAVILLGFGLNLSVIFSTGKQSLPIILSTITTSLIMAYILHKAMHIPSKISTLIGVGSSICGGSAIAATAPVIDASDEEVAQSISVIFLFNVIAALIFPSLGSILGMSTEGFGLFAGTAINDTSSVTAAASAWDGIHHGSNALEIATIVKLTRTLAIIPITLALAFLRTRKEKAANTNVKVKNIFPFFILYFLLASVITTVFSLSPVITAPIKELSKFFIIMAMSAIGLNTNIIKLIKNGGKPIFMGICCWLGITLVSILMQMALGIM
ncbi:YeiH family protein [Aminipila terrae]|uniref:Putative sulfate exporter family transporter n=1 Tax=Aminipila terrae TaxID=2697030 RepID=A0A6P1MIE2_9FIRM|nr:YeiH family protein [Aminipila terrae]QHI73832.1 putative sulfate exporter family transporter [Aminipila terrae]